MSRKIAPEMSCPPRQQNTITLPAEAALLRMLPVHSFPSYFYRRFWR